MERCIEWSEEDVADLIERRCALLGMIGLYESRHSIAAGRIGEEAAGANADSAELRRELAQIQKYLARAGISFDT